MTKNLVSKIKNTILITTALGVGTMTLANQDYQNVINKVNYNNSDNRVTYFTKTENTDNKKEEKTYFVQETAILNYKLKKEQYVPIARLDENKDTLNKKHIDAYKRSNN